MFVLILIGVAETQNKITSIQFPPVSLPKIQIFNLNWEGGIPD